MLSSSFTRPPNSRAVTPTWASRSRFLPIKREFISFLLFYPSIRLEHNKMWKEKTGGSGTLWPYKERAYRFSITALRSLIINGSERGITFFLSARHSQETYYSFLSCDFPSSFGSKLVNWIPLSEWEKKSAHYIRLNGSLEAERLG